MTRPPIVASQSSERMGRDGSGGAGSSGATVSGADWLTDMIPPGTAILIERVPRVTG